MKQVLLVIIISFLGVFNTNAQEIDFFHGSFEEAMQLAIEQDRVIFVDAFTTWCGPCKRMAATTFKDDKVGKFFNTNFINLKLDMDKAKGIEFKRKYPVSAYPTLFFISKTGEMLQKVVGGQKVEGLLRVANTVLSKIDYSIDFKKEYDKGNRDPELIYDYVMSLNKSHKSSLKISNDYLRSQKDLKTDFNLKFILEAAVESDSRIFDLLLENKSKIIKLTSKSEVQKKIYIACRNTADKAIEFEDEDLLVQAQKILKKHGEGYKAFNAETNKLFYKNMVIKDKYLLACKDYSKYVAKEDPDKLMKNAKSVLEFLKNDKKAIEWALKEYKRASKIADDYKIYYTYASILSRYGNIDDALKVAKIALEKVENKEDKRQTAPIEQLIKVLTGES